MTFSSAKRIGVEPEKEKRVRAKDAIDVIDRVFKNDPEVAVTFGTSKKVGVFDKDREDEASTIWTYVSDAIEEEDWAVMNAVLLTFFLTMVFFFIIGFCISKHCKLSSKQFAGDASTIVKQDDETDETARSDLKSLEMTTPKRDE